jgi:uncharacterized RDD family membrane protein YckC
MVTEHNPYAPPAAAVSETAAGGQESEQEPASRGRRFANLLIDTLCYYALTMVVGVGIALVDASFLEHMSTVGEYLFGTGLMLVYYLPSEALFGRTVGKLVTRTRVVSQSGGPPDFLQVLRRTLIRFVPFEAFTFLSERSVGLHDRWSETRVVLTRSEHSR